MKHTSDIGPLLLPDDGFPTTYAEPWFKQKLYSLLQYIEAYAVSMSYRVDELNLIELFSGNGIQTIGENSGKFTALNLSLLARNLSYHKYCFCPLSEEDARALRVRINKWHRKKNVVLLEGERADLIKRIKLYIPKSTSNFKVGNLCVIDAFTLKLDYVWLDLLADQGFDFLIVFTFPLNEMYNWQYYLKEERATLSKFLGSWNAVEKLERESQDNLSFYKKLFELHQHDMKLLGYDCLAHSYKFDSGLMNTPFYYTACFTKYVSSKLLQKELGETSQIDLFNPGN